MENIKRREFESVEPFDIIWAKRDVEENEVFDDEKGYEGSYIVIGRDVDKLYCLRGGQKIKDYYDPYIVFSRLTKNKYGEDKIIYYVNIDVKVVDYDKFINMKTRLNVEEKRDLVCELKKQKSLNDRKCYDIDLSIKSGDIIKKDKLYLVIYKHNDDLHCIEIDDDKDLENSFYIGNIKKINYNNTIILNVNDSNIKFINKVSNELFKEVLGNYKELNYHFMNYMLKKRNMQEGLLIEKDDILYYVSKVISNKLICNEVKVVDEEEISNLKINNINYNANFYKDVVINIEEDFKPIALATAVEKKRNNAEYNKTKDYLIKIRESLNSGKIFKIDKDSYDYYVYIESVDEKVKCINLLELNRNEFVINYIDINEIIYTSNIPKKEIEKNKKKIRSLLKIEDL